MLYSMFVYFFFYFYSSRRQLHDKQLNQKHFCENNKQFVKTKRTIVKVAVSGHWLKLKIKEPKQSQDDKFSGAVVDGRLEIKQKINKKQRNPRNKTKKKRGNNVNPSPLLLLAENKKNLKVFGAWIAKIQRKCRNEVSDKVV